MASYVLCWNSTFVFQFEPAILVNTILETFFLPIFSWCSSMKSLDKVAIELYLHFRFDQEFQNQSILVKSQSYNSKYYLSNSLSPLVLSEPLLSVNFSV